MNKFTSNPDRRQHPLMDPRQACDYLAITRSQPQNLYPHIHTLHILGENSSLPL